MKQIKSKLYLYTAAVCILVIIGLVYYYFFTPLSEHDTVQYVYIDDDDTQDSVFAKMETIANKHALTGFRAIARHSGYDNKIHTGRYAVAPKENAFTVYRRLKNGVQAPIRLTIPETRTMNRLAGFLAGKLMIDSTEIAQALGDSAFCGKYGYTPETIPALFVPDTYEVYWNLTLDDFMRRMLKEHNAFWKGQRTDKAKAMGMTPNEVATMASIIDEETANNAEKPMIAGMYYNRLKQEMPLQADPTVKFAWKDFSIKRIYNKLLRIENPYNTYKNIGLPPGPIKIASVAGIDAVLDHVKHDYLYMCAKEDFSGTHNFARTYEEHLENAARYTKALNERGIR
ncbi:endolytic transglycosylase MltG [Xylanibacter muris]|uniref:Endolytic murein transglycosylase n=1 Tax=Xylanibacter muris TaxID=2736290 RepID=A0ABX2ASC3_9BACT|nr:endolytic transglycosylase MltG [Xylanibacter muris]NPD93104.1 endolytic transglycosylase MltG [Xylanibacter muris]